MGDLRSPYLALSLIGFIQGVWSLFCMPETLDKDQRRPISSYAEALNPFGFMNIYSKGSASLKKLVTITTMQMSLEGKNQHDVTEVWKREELKLAPGPSRNHLVLAGVAFIMGGATATPYVLKNFSTRMSTSIMNWMNVVGLGIQGFPYYPQNVTIAGSPIHYWIFIATLWVRCAGMNGASSNALKAVQAEQAEAEGFGKGEFSAWANNLRGLSGSAAPIIFGAYYSWARRRGINGSTFFWFAGLTGALLPQLGLMMMSDEELTVKKKESKSSAS